MGRRWPTQSGYAAGRWDARVYLQCIRQNNSRAG
nr:MULTISPECIES: hypothetical protein [Pseudomonas]